MKRYCYLKVILIFLCTCFFPILQGCAPKINLRKSYDFPPIKEPPFTSIKVIQFKRISEIPPKASFIQHPPTTDDSYLPSIDDAFSQNLAEAMKKANLAETIYYSPEEDNPADYIITGEIIKFSQNLKDEVFGCLGPPMILIPVLMPVFLIIACLDIYPLESNIKIQVKFQDVKKQKIILNKLYQKSETKKVNHWRPWKKFEVPIKELMGQVIEEIINDLKALLLN